MQKCLETLSRVIAADSVAVECIETAGVGEERFKTSGRIVAAIVVDECFRAGGRVELASGVVLKCALAGGCVSGTGGVAVERLKAAAGVIIGIVV